MTTSSNTISLFNDNSIKLKDIDIDNFEKLSAQYHYTEFDDFPYVNACDFLYGSCNLFALALHNKFNYAVYEIIDDEDKLIHVFCITSYNDELSFVDVRGITNDAKSFFIEFFNFSPLKKGTANKLKIRLRDLSEDQQDLTLNNNFEKIAYSFSNEIINLYSTAYSK